MSTIHLTHAPPGVFPPDVFDGHRRSDLEVAVVHASGSDTTLATACMTVLEALGKDAKVAGGKDHASDNTRWLPLWLLAHHVAWLVITDPHVWPERVLFNLLRIITATQTQVLLAVRDHAAERMQPVVSMFATERVQWGDVGGLLGTGQHRSAAAASTTTIGPPDSDWYRYRADCKALLPADQYVELDAHYRYGFSEAQARLAAGTPDSESIRDLLAALVVAAPARAHALSRVRAVQAALFQGGWNLRISVTHLMKFLGTAADLAFTEADWHALRAYRTPYRPALVALHQAGMPADQIMGVTVGQVSDALTTRTINGFALASEADPYLTAQLLDRAIDGGTRDDVFIDGATNLPGVVINRAAHDLGLLIGAHRAPTNPNTAMFWQFRAGFLLESL